MYEVLDCHISVEFYGLAAFMIESKLIGVMGSFHASKEALFVSEQKVRFQKGYYRLLQMTGKRFIVTKVYLSECTDYQNNDEPIDELFITPDKYALDTEMYSISSFVDFPDCPSTFDC